MLDKCRFGAFVLAVALAAGACADDTGGNNGANNGANNGGTNNGGTNNGGTNNGGTNNGGTNNGGTNNGGTNNGGTNNGGTNNGGTNNGTANNGTNNGTGNNGTNNGTNTPGVAVEDFGTTLFEAYCEASFDCVGSDFWANDDFRLVLNAHGTKQDCLDAAAEMANSGLFNESDLIAGVNAGRLTWDALAAEACIDAIALSLCDMEFPQDACDGFVTGAVASGSACVVGWGECATDGDTCEVADGACAGTCSTPTCGGVVCQANEFCNFSDVCEAYVGPGGTCDFSSDCDPGQNLVCNTVMAAGTCVAEGSVAPGAACSTSRACQNGYRCDFDTDVCIPISGPGETCEFDSHCDDSQNLECNYNFDTGTGTCVVPGTVADGQYCYDSTFCADTSYCDFDTDLCTAGNKPDGMDCVFDRECAAGLICFNPSGTGTCMTVADVPSGGTCDRSDVCAAGLFCDFASNTCSDYGDAGDSCNFFSCKAGLACQDLDPNTFEGMCGALRGDGEACMFFDQCQWGYGCVNDVCTLQAPAGAACNAASECSSFVCNDTSMCEDPMACTI